MQSPAFLFSSKKAPGWVPSTQRSSGFCIFTAALLRREPKAQTHNDVPTQWLDPFRRPNPHAVCFPLRYSRSFRPSFPISNQSAPTRRRCKSFRNRLQQPSNCRLLLTFRSRTSTDFSLPFKSGRNHYQVHDVVIRHAWIDWLFVTFATKPPSRLNLISNQLSLSVRRLPANPTPASTLSPISDFTALPTEVGRTICRA